VDSLTFGGKILPNADDISVVDRILIWIKIQLFVFVLGAIILFYFISFSWVAGILTGLLFAFIYVSITLILLSGFRKSSYFKNKQKRLFNEKIIVGTTQIEVENKHYDDLPGKSQLIASVILRAIYIIAFAFSIFCGLALGVSMLFYPKLEEMHGSEIIQNYEKSYPQLYGKQIDAYKNQILKLKFERATIVSKLGEIQAEINQANDTFHKDFFLVDKTILTKQLLDWELLHQQELSNLPIKIDDLDAEYQKGLTKLALSIKHSKFGIYRIQHLLNHQAFISFILISCLIFLFIYPFYLRYKMVLSESDLDIKLELATVDFIKFEYEKSTKEIYQILKGFNYPHLERLKITGESPFKDGALLKSEKVALKNQMDTFLKNELT
jgi:hypothetical protein